MLGPAGEPAATRDRGTPTQRRYERRAEDDHFEAREAEERGANQRAVTDAAREEQVRLTEEMDGEFTDDETGSDED